MNDVINQYEMMDRKVEDDKEKRSAEEFQLQTPDDENSSGSDSDVPVSYTHLDVYKRQGGIAIIILTFG